MIELIVLMTYKSPEKKEKLSISSCSRRLHKGGSGPACLSVNHPRTIHLRGRHCSALYRRRLYLHCCHGRLSSNLNFVTVGESGFTEERAEEDRLVSCGEVFFFFFYLSVTVKLCQRKREEASKSSLRFVLFSFFVFSE